MGGGAGIHIKVRLESFYFKWTGRHMTIAPARPEIVSWDAIGYSDGMTQITPSLLRVCSISPAHMDKSGIVWCEATLRRGDLLYARVERNIGHVAETMIFSGYLRYHWQTVFYPLELTGACYMEQYGSSAFDLCVQPRNRKIFASFWRDVFEPVKENTEGWSVSDWNHRAWAIERKWRAS